MDRCINEQEFREYKVTEFSRYKRRGGTQHEYIVAKVVHPLHDSVQYIKIERDFRPRDKLKLYQNQLSTQDVSQRFLKTLFRPFIAQDAYAAGVVTFWGPHLHPNTVADFRLERMVLSIPLLLVHLAILADVVHEKEHLYNLSTTQSYWYSNLIARVIAREYTSTEGESVPNAEVYYTMNTNGRWIPIPRPELVSVIQDENRARRDRFDEACIFSLVVIRSRI